MKLKKDNQKKLIITRPSGMNENSMSFFKDQSFIVESLPLIRIVPKSQDHWLDAIEKIDYYHHVIVTSPITALFFVEALRCSWEEVPHLRYWALGTSTAMALGELNSPISYPKQGNTSEDFLQYIQGEILTDDRVLIIGGDDPRSFLFESLDRRGAQVDHLSLYSRSSIIYDIKRLSEVFEVYEDLLHFVLTTSGDIVRSLYSNLEQDDELMKQVQSKAIILTPSARVQEIASDLGFVNVHNASSATDEGILSLLGKI